MMQHLALIRIKKNHKKSILICSLFCVFLMAMQILFPIYRAAKNIRKDLAKSLESCFVVESLVNSDMTEAHEYIEMENGYVLPMFTGDSSILFTQDKIDVIAGVDGIESYNSSTDTILYNPDLEIEPGLNENYDLKEYEEDRQKGIDVESDHLYWWTILSSRSSTYFGCLDSSKDDYFLRGAVKLIEGRHIRPDDRGVVLISKWLAEHNDLKIGDHFTSKSMQNYAYGTGTTEDVLNEYTFEVIGIFDVISTQFYPLGNDYMQEIQNLHNNMFCDYYTASEANQDIDEFIYGYRKSTEQRNHPEVTFFVEDPQKIDSVIARVKQLDFYSPKYYKIHYGNSAFTASIAPLSKMQKITGAFLVLTVTGVAVMMSAAERLITQKNRREIGILLSVGKRRGAILRSFLTETLILLLIAEAVAAPVGLLTASRIGETMYRKGDNSYVIETEYGEQRVLPIQPGQWDSFVDVPSYAPEEIDVSVSVWDCVYAFLLCGGIVLVIQMISLLLILKERPRKLILQR